MHWQLENKSPGLSRFLEKVLSRLRLTDTDPCLVGCMMLYVLQPYVSGPARDTVLYPLAQLDDPPWVRRWRRN